MQKTKTILKFTIFPLIILMIVWSLVVFLSQTTSEDEARLKLFYNEPTNSIDAIYIGPSTVRSGILPTEIYKTAGWTGYDFALNSLPANLVKPILQECEIVQKPKLYVIEITDLTYDKVTNDVAVKKFLSAVPSRQRRNEYIDQLFDKDSRFKWKDQLYNNHSNWQNLKDITKGMKVKIDKRSSVLKGTGFSLYQANLDTTDAIDVTNYDVERELKKELLKTFNELLDYIEKENLNVLFFKMPKFYDEKSIYEYERTLYVERILKERGFNYVDYSRQMERLELNGNDYYDFHHLNLDGAYKLTAAMVEDIQSLNLLPEISHSEKVEENWKLCAEKVDKFIEKLRAENYANKKFIINDISYFLKNK